MNLEKKAFELRKKVLDMCVRAGTGHVTSSFSCVEILATLYEVMVPNDRLVISKGHCSPLVYAILADRGVIPQEDLDGFAKDKFGVHLQYNIPGVEITAGSLGIGLGIAAGMAYAKKLDRESGTIYCLLGDGECYEGSIWEAAMFAGHHELDNLVAIVDRNRLAVTDFTENIIKLEPFIDKWKSFGWWATEIDGHSTEYINMVLNWYIPFKKPKLIVADTIKGKGIPFMENVPLWHGIAPSGEDAVKAQKLFEEEL